MNTPLATLKREIFLSISKDCRAVLAMTYSASLRGGMTKQSISVIREIRGKRDPSQRQDDKSL